MSNYVRITYYVQSLESHDSVGTAARMYAFPKFNIEHKCLDRKRIP